MTNSTLITPTQIVSQHSAKVFALVTGIVGNRDDAEELTQDIFMKVFAALPKFQNKSSLSTWIYRIAYNMAIDFTRKRKVKTVELKEEIYDRVGPATDYDSTKELKLTELERAITKINREDRFLIEMHYWQKFTVEQIAEILNQSKSNVKVRLHRTRKRLSQLMEPKEIEPKEMEYKEIETREMEYKEIEYKEADNN